MIELNIQAWLKKEKKMVNVISWSHHNYLNSIEYSTSQSSDGVHQVRLEDVELRLYFGLKDKNNVEIYEGDIIEWNKTLYEIKFSLNRGIVGKKLSGINIHTELNCEQIQQGSIFGNIFKNPELIEGINND